MENIELTFTDLRKADVHLKSFTFKFIRLPGLTKYRSQRHIFNVNLHGKNIKTYLNATNHISDCQKTSIISGLELFQMENGKKTQIIVAVPS